MNAAPEARTPRVPAEANAEETKQPTRILTSAGDEGNACQKQRETAFALLALAGHAAYELADGGYIVTRWGFTRHCVDLHALMHFARQVGGAA